MDEQNQIIAETINTSRFFIIFMSYVLGGTYLSVGLASILQSPIIGMIGLVLFAVLPLSLMRRISGFFTNNIRVDFFSDHLAVLVFKSETDSLLNERVIYYKELMSCTINSTGKSLLTFLPRDKLTSEFVVQSCSFSFLRLTAFRFCLSLNYIQGHFSNDVIVYRGVSFLFEGIVFFENDIE